MLCSTVRGGGSLFEETFRPVVGALKFMLMSPDVVLEA